MLACAALVGLIAAHPAAALARSPAAARPARPAVPPASRAMAHPLLPVMCAAMRSVLAVLDPPPGQAPAAGGGSGDVRPSLVTYDGADVRSWRINAGFGALQDSSSWHDVHVTVRMRVGDRQLDNTHHVANDRSEGLRLSRTSSTVTLPPDGPEAALVRILEDETDKRFARAIADLGAMKGARAAASAAQDESADLSEELPQVSVPPLGRLEFDPAGWQGRIRRVSAAFRDHPQILGQDAWLRLTDETRLLVTSEGTVIQHRGTRAFVGMRAWVRTADGEDLSLQWDEFAPAVESLPGEAALLDRARDVAARVEALRLAPEADPYVGPMLVAGKAAGVLFHEVLGHPLEGERQRAEEQAQTFKGKVGERILPEFLDVIFDPTLASLGPAPLSGSFVFDDEGVRARRVVSVEKGVLRAFLMSRRPIAGFPHSNGHGRTEGMPLPMARQSNLLVTTSLGLGEPELRQRLVDLARARGLAYGLYVASVERGATRTSRGEPNAFQVVPVEVFRVFVDGRPDQLIRGAELVGTPLTALLKIVAAGRESETFNGVCGAESGWVPVSASSPMLLIEEIEVQRAAKSSERLPLLPPPAAGSPGPGPAVPEAASRGFSPPSPANGGEEVR